MANEAYPPRVRRHVVTDPAACGDGDEGVVGVKRRINIPLLILAVLMLWQAINTSRRIAELDSIEKQVDALLVMIDDMECRR